MNSQRGAVLGSAGGGALGAIIGNAAGNSELGAIMGSSVGGVTGEVIGKKMDSQADEMRIEVPSSLLFEEGKNSLIIPRFFINTVASKCIKYIGERCDTPIDMDLFFF